jgi:hypothetical protein
MKTLGTYFENIDHVATSERINHYIFINPSFFEENGITEPIHFYMDNVFGLRPKELQHPNVVVYTGPNDPIVGQAIARVSLLKPYFYNVRSQNLDRVCGLLELIDDEAGIINKVMSYSSSIIQDPIIDVNKYNITVYQYILFIYNTCVINIMPSRFTRTDRFKDEEYVINITNNNLNDVLNRYTRCITTNTRPIPMDYTMPDYTKLTRVKVTELDD